LPHFYFCLDTRHLYKEPTRKEQIKLLRKLSKAASTLHTAVTSLDMNFCLPLNLLAPDEGAVGVTDHFIATLELLAITAAGKIEKPALIKSRRGRPPKNEPFRQLTPILVRTYEVVRKESAECPYYLPDSRDYGGKGDFHRFALAVWCCLQENLPAEARAGLPGTKGGLAQELQKHWQQDDAKR
jgi:hypothetical protein